MRLIATAIACVLAAFGAAFLVGRAANHQDSAAAATTTTGHHGTPVTSTSSTSTSSSTHANRALAAQFQPGLQGLRHKPKARKRAHHATPAPAVVTPQTTTQSYSPPSYTAPAYTAPAKPAPTTHHKSGGSGTTTIG